MDMRLVLKALADETRMQILELLLQHSICVRALADELQLTEATISQHLRVLREAGLLTGEKRGYYMHYSVERQVLHRLADAIKALANDEQEACQPDKHDDCPSTGKQDRVIKATCSDEVRQFCHGAECDQGD